MSYKKKILFEKIIEAIVYRPHYVVVPVPWKFLCNYIELDWSFYSNSSRTRHCSKFKRPVIIFSSDGYYGRLVIYSNLS